MMRDPMHPTAAELQQEYGKALAMIAGQAEELATLRTENAKLAEWIDILRAEVARLMPAPEERRY